MYMYMYIIYMYIPTHVFLVFPSHFFVHVVHYVCDCSCVHVHMYLYIIHVHVHVCSCIQYITLYAGECSAGRGQWGWWCEQPAVSLEGEGVCVDGAVQTAAHGAGQNEAAGAAEGEQYPPAMYTV